MSTTSQAAVELLLKLLGAILPPVLGLLVQRRMALPDKTAKARTKTRRKQARAGR